LNGMSYHNNLYL